MSITFCGGAREVTGSCYLFETDAARFLVDYGMVKGWRSAMQALPHAPGRVE